MVSVFVLIVIMLNVVMPTVIHAKCYNTVCRYAECLGAAVITT